MLHSFECVSSVTESSVASRRPPRQQRGPRSSAILVALALAAGSTLLTAGGCGGEEADDETATTAAPTVDPTAGTVTETGYTSDFFGFGIGYRADWVSHTGQTPDDCPVYFASGVAMSGSLGVSAGLESGPDSGVMLHLRKGCSMLTIETEAAEGDAAASLAAQMRPFSFSQMFTADGDPVPVTIGGAAMAEVRGRYTVGSQPFLTRSICYVKDGRALYITLLAENATVAQELDSIVGTMTFH